MSPVSEVRRQVEFAVAVSSSEGHEQRKTIVDEVMAAVKPFLKEEPEEVE